MSSDGPYHNERAARAAAKDLYGADWFVTHYIFSTSMGWWIAVSRPIIPSRHYRE